MTNNKNIQQMHDALKSRRDTLIEMMEDYNGFDDSVIALFKAKKLKKLEGILGVVAELIEVPEYIEAAIHAILGDAVEHVVVETDSAGFAAADYLKHYNLGRVTFLPMNLLNYSEKSAVMDIQGVGLAIKLISYNPMYHPVISHLLGDVYIVETLTDARNIIKLHQHEQQFRVATLEGDILTTTGGSFTAGSQIERKENLLSRKRMIAELEKEIVELGKQLSSPRKGVSQ